MKLFVLLFAAFLTISGPSWANTPDFKAIAKQQTAHQAAVAKYKNTWDPADVKVASDLAFTPENAAWPWINLAKHQIDETSGVAVSTYLDSAETALAKATGAVADKIRVCISHDRAWVKAHPDTTVVDESEDVTEKGK